MHCTDKKSIQIYLYMTEKVLGRFCTQFILYLNNLK